MTTATIAFRTATPTITDRTSAAVTIESIYFDKKMNAIIVQCSDKRTRVCKIDRMESIEAARALWVQLKDSLGWSAKFTAAGGFSPDNWFYTFTIAS